MSQEDKFKVGQRAQRFAKGQEGNKKFKPKLKIGELLKSVVNEVIYLSEITVLFSVCDRRGMRLGFSLY